MAEVLLMPTPMATPVDSAAALPLLGAQPASLSA